jgi:hypothetical protein
VATVDMIPVFQGGFNIFLMMIFGVIQVIRGARYRCTVSGV